MEGRRSFVNGNNRLTRPASGTRLTNTSENNTSNREKYEYGVREPNQFLPISKVIRIMRKILPSHAKISDNTKETVQECVSEFINFVTGEANERCQREQRKTITADDLLWSMGKLGFNSYVEPLSLYLNRYRIFEGDRSSVVPRDQMMNRNVELASFSAPAYPPFVMAPHPGMFAPQQMNGFFREGPNTNQNNQAPGSIHPYAPYK